MPNYDFVCSACGHRFVRNQPLGTQHTECPDCGRQAKKTFTAPAIHFAAKGFYAVDSRTGNSETKPASTPTVETGSTKSPEATPSAPSGTATNKPSAESA